MTTLAANPDEWTAEDVSHYPEDCSVTDACGRWIDDSTGELVVILWHDLKRDLLHGYRIWNSWPRSAHNPDMWHVNGTRRLVEMYTAERPSASIDDREAQTDKDAPGGDGA